MRPLKDGVAWLAVLLAFVSVVFGGEHRNNPLGVGVMAFVASPLLALTLWDLISTGSWRRHRLSLTLLALCWALLLVQLVPVPISLYALAPGRAQALAALDLAGVRPALLPLSMNPAATFAALLGSLPATAMFLAVLNAAGEQRRRLVIVYLGLVAFAVALAVVQMATHDPAFYAYSRVRPGQFVGFFANRNHQATLVLAALPLSAVAFVRGRAGEGPVRLLATAGACLVAIVALAAARSRFGVLLALPVSALTLTLAATRLGAGLRLRTGLLTGLLVLGLALSVIIPLGLAPIVRRFTEDSSFSRLDVARRSLAVAETYSPLGAGVGSFDQVYRAAEATDSIGPTFLNAAHNDYVQVFLEAGWPGFALLIAILGAIVVATWRVWRARGENVIYGRAASVALAVIALHSIVDYPLRTGAIAVLAAALAGLLAQGVALGQERTVAKLKT